MKNLFALIVLAASTHASAQLAAVNGYCEQGAQPAQVSGMNSTNKLQGIVPGCLVTPYLTGTTTLATYYLTPAGNPQTGPFTADTTTGQWLCYAAINLGYDVAMSTGRTNTGIFPGTNINVGCGSNTGVTCDVAHGGTGATTAAGALANLGAAAADVVSSGTSGQAAFYTSTTTVGSVPNATALGTLVTSGGGLSPVPGLVGDGSTDDSGAITTALSTGGSFELPTNLQAGGGTIALANTVYFSEGGSQLHGQGWSMYAQAGTTQSYSPSTGSAIRMDGQLTPGTWTTNTPYTRLWAGTVDNMNILAPNTDNGAGLLLTDISLNSGNVTLSNLLVKAQHGIYALSYDGSQVDNVYTVGGSHLLPQQAVNVFGGNTSNSLNIKSLRGSCSTGTTPYFSQLLFGIGNRVRISETGGCGGILYVGGWGTAGTTPPTLTPTYALVPYTTGGNAGYTMTAITVSGGSSDWVQPVQATFSTTQCPIAPTIEPIVNAPLGTAGQITQIKIVDGGWCNTAAPTITLKANQTYVVVNDFDIGDTEVLQGPTVFVAHGSSAQGRWAGFQGQNYYLGAPYQVDVNGKLTLTNNPGLNQQMAAPVVTDGGTGGGGTYASGGTFYFFLQAASSLSCNPTVAVSTYVPPCINAVSAAAAITLPANHQALVTFPSTPVAAPGGATVTYTIYRGTTATASASTAIATVTLPATSYLSNGSESTVAAPASSNIPLVALLTPYSNAVVTSPTAGPTAAYLGYGDTGIDSYGNYYNLYSGEPVLNSLPPASLLYRTHGVWVLCKGGLTCTDGFYKSLCTASGGAISCAWSSNLLTGLSASNSYNDSTGTHFTMDQTGAGSPSTPFVYFYADGSVAASAYIKFVQIYNSNTTAGAQGLAIYDSTASTTNLLGYSFANNASYFEHPLYMSPQVLATSNTTQQASNKITSIASAWCGAGSEAKPQYADNLQLGSGTNPTMTRMQSWTPGACTGVFLDDFSTASYMKIAQIVAAGSLPTMAPGAAAGSSPTCTTVTGVNKDGTISCTTGSATTTGVLATVTFNPALAVAPVGCSLTPRTATTTVPAGSVVWTGAPSTTTWTVNVGAVALSTGTNYSWSYNCE